MSWPPDASNTAFSIIAWPSPCAIEPWVWPSTIMVIERPAAIVDRGIADERKRTGRRIDLHLGDVAAVGKGERRLGSWSWCRDLRRSRRAFSSPWRAPRDRTARCARSVPTTPKRPSRYSMSASAVSSTVAAIALPLASMRLDGLDHGVAHGHGRARADRGIARDLHGGIAVPVLDLLGLDAEPLCQHRVEHGGVALAGRLHVEAEQQLLAAGKRQRGAFERKAAGMLEHAGDADARDICRAWRLRAGAA